MQTETPKVEATLEVRGWKPLTLTTTFQLKKNVVDDWSKLDQAGTQITPLYKYGEHLKTHQMLE